MRAHGLGESVEPELTARGHAERVVRRDSQAHADLAPGAEIAPPDLVEWLLSHPFTRFEMVAHARIGAHHIFKTKFVGPTTVVIQARWVAEPGGHWRIREAEVTRTEGEPVGPPGPGPRSGEV